MANYLLEIGLEEIPARFLKDLSNQLAERMANFLNEEQLAYANIRQYATPRRLAILVEDVAAKQADRFEKAKGPSLKIAKDDQGNWSRAALGFLKGQGAEVEDIVIESVKGQEYIFVEKHIVGQMANEILAKVDQVLSAMTFPVSMRWNQIETAFIRPVHWLVSLLDEDIIPFEFLNIRAGRASRGHRFLAGDVIIDQADHYENLLEQHYVIADFNQRQAIIRQQIADIEQENQWVVPIDQGLLEEVTAIVEWPTAFAGQFDDKYLEIPAMILITAMRDHQRYFYVQDQASKDLLPYFISVRNGDSKYLDNVRQGNLKVLRARLEDALFFYQEDLKRPLNFYLEQLSQVKEHYKLGTYAEKQSRVGKILNLLDELIPNLDDQEFIVAQRASQIYKFDLMTYIVDEFSELQGHMGQVYAEHYGESQEVAQAIGSQYYPDHSGGALPESQAGALIALADKLDSLFQYFNVGLIPTGSNDPYALRRQAMGVVEISLDRQWDFDLVELFDKLASDKAENSESLIQALKEFHQARFAQLMTKEDIDHDIIEAITAQPKLNLLEMTQTARHLQTFKNQAAQDYRQMVENISRIVNLGRDIDELKAIQKEALQSKSEFQLIEWLDMVKSTKTVVDFINLMAQASPMIATYFEENMVNHEDPVIRENRLQTMGHLSHYILSVFDPTRLISKF
ncbi:glycine--tRNA ligase subunit beta [Ignavigranum ruoffiae]|uniref:glycine--tRNA ligase subunit beta n=1 Tax=Ignavigranum ruoffiae TaxID=89093 RepID=UPI0024AD2226|nr:glycine--tRNA ligase subunit beta [Ignavigranum ruoffiae]